MDVEQRSVRRYREAVHGLDRSSEHSGTVLDLGVQDTGTDAAAWALEVREAALPREDQVLLWTLRGAPQVYRRADLAQVRTAVSPRSEADAAKRVVTAAKPLREAGIAVLEALHTTAATMRAVVTAPTAKGELSSALTERLPDAYLRWCGVCKATHPYELVFRLATAYAGLELGPGTSPPVLRRTPGRCTVGPSAQPLSAPERLQPVRAYLHLHGPATPKEVAAYLDSPVSDVTRVWPEDVERVTVDKTERWVLAQDVDALRDPPSAGGTFLLAPYDPLLQGRDRESLVADPDRRKELWRTLGRPGAVLHDGEVVASWRPRSRGGRLEIAVNPWASLAPRTRRAIEEQAGRLAAFRGLEASGVTYA